MTLTALEEAVLRPMATGFRNMTEAMSAVPGLVVELEGVDGRALQKMERAYEQADIKMQEVNYWMRDLRSLLLSLTDEAKAAAKKQADQIEKGLKEAAGAL